MPLILILPLFTILFCTCVRAQTSDYTQEDRQAYLERRGDSTTWDRNMLAEDLEWQSELNGVGPLPNGVFPVPKYALNGRHGFGGAMSTGNAFQPDTIAGKLLVHQSFGLGNYPIEMDAADDRYTIFFTIATVVDTLKADGGGISSSIVGSRNNPDVVAQGYIETTIERISYVAFITAEGRRYALVNMRLFDLSYGDVIVIVPHKDGSLRSLQLDTQARGGKRNEEVLDELFRSSHKLQSMLREDGVL